MLSRLYACEDRTVVHWCGMQASSHNSQGVVDGGVNKAGMSIVAPNRSAVLCSRMTRSRVAVHNVVAPAPQPEPANRFKSATRDVSFLRSDSRCRQYVSDLSNVTLRCLGFEQNGKVSLLKLTFSSRLGSLLLRWKTANTVFAVLSFSF